MGTSLTGMIINEEFIKALGNTLIHSLWQGVLLAAAGAAIIVCTKKQRAAVRYNLLIAALLAFTCGVGLTFIIQLQPAFNSTGIQAASGHANVHALSANPALNIVVADRPAEPNIGDTLTSFFNQHCNTIVLLWFLVLCIKSIRLAVGGYEIFLLKRTKLSPVSDYWTEKVQQLATRLKVKQAITFAESALAKTPMVIGHLKPLILIPVGFINALPANEVEAILIHELAHIRRRDYLVNLLQSFMEVVFFFNPAVMWISQLLKAERENCCDDIAIGQTGGKANYIQALLSCQEYQLAAPGLSMAFANNKNTLLNRVKRIVNNNNQSLNIVEKTLLTICLVTAGLFTVAFSAKDSKSKPAVIARHLEHHVDTKIANVFNVDTAEQPSENADESSADSTSESNAQTTAESQVIEPAVAPVAAADTGMSLKAKIYNPSDLGDGTTLHVSDDKSGKAVESYLFKRGDVLYQVFEDKGRTTALYINGKAVPASDYKDKIKDLLRQFDELAQPKPVVAPVVRVAVTPAVAVSPTPVESVSVSSSVSAPAAPARVAAPPAPPAPPARADFVNTGSGENFEEIADMLFERGYIKDRGNIEFSITNKFLEINGVRQPDELHKELIKKFVKKPGDKINWRYSRHSS